MSSRPLLHILAASVLMVTFRNANLLASSIQYIINVVMTVPALIWMDRWGRRPTLLVGSTLMMTWMFANAGMSVNLFPTCRSS